MADSGEPPAKKAKKTTKGTKSLPACPYGARCYRKNPAHFKEFSHPDEDDDAAVAGPSSVPIDTSKLPPCEYGANCYRKNLLHFAEYSHPFSSTGAGVVPDDSGSDTDVLEDEEKTEDVAKKKDNKRSDSLALAKSYSKMTEDERRELIRKAFEAKAALQKELEETKNTLAEKNKKLKKLQDQVSTGLLLMDGEKEALEGDEVKYFPLYAERSYREGSADQVHFRLAESQFYRLLSGGAGYRVTKVEYIVNPVLAKHFREAREDLNEERGEDMSYPVLAFHGTKVENIEPIVEKGFKVPGEKGFSHRTDTGWYGKGVYFSEYPGYSMGYIQGAQKLLLCQVLPGKVFQCTKLIHGKPLAKGYDSHVSPDKMEIIIFNAHHILPSYVVHYAHSTANFKYKKKLEEREKLWLSGDALNKLYWKASKAKSLGMFNAVIFDFFGKLCDSKERLKQLVEKHGAMGPKHFKGNPAFINSYQKVLVCTREMFKKQPAALKNAKTHPAGAHIIHEQFIYDSILKKVLQDYEDYYFD